MGLRTPNMNFVGTQSNPHQTCRQDKIRDWIHKKENKLKPKWVPCTASHMTSFLNIFSFSRGSQNLLKSCRNYRELPETLKAGFLGSLERALVEGREFLNLWVGGGSINFNCPLLKCWPSSDLYLPQLEDSVGVWSQWENEPGCSFNVCSIFRPMKLLLIGMQCSISPL